MSDRDNARWGEKWRAGGSMSQGARDRLADEIETLALSAAGAKSEMPMTKVVIYAMSALRGLDFTKEE